MKTKKHHFGKRWAIRDQNGLWETHTRGVFKKDIIQAMVWNTAKAAQTMALMNDVFCGHQLEVVTIKETVYVVEI